MANRSIEIKINSTEANKDVGFEVLASSGLSIISLEDDGYIVPEEAINLLNKNSVIHNIISINGERIEDASQFKSWGLYSHTLQSK